MDEDVGAAVLDSWLDGQWKIGGPLKIDLPEKTDAIGVLSGPGLHLSTARKDDLVSGRLACSVILQSGGRAVGGSDPKHQKTPCSRSDVPVDRHRMPVGNHRLIPIPG